MIKTLLPISFLFLLASCSQKIYFFEADKLEMDEPNDLDIEVNAFFAGDALDYVVFELDVRNNTMDTIHLNYNDIYLSIKEEQEVVLNALDKFDLIEDAKSRQEHHKREKRGNDIGNAILIGLDLFLVGSGNLNAVDGLIYTTETASYMLEDSRAYKLLKGSIDEQIQYIEDWVLQYAYIPPQSEDTWDILFERKLYDNYADLVVKIKEKEYSIPFNIITKEERIR